MDWTQTFTVLGVLSAFMFYMIQRLEKDMDKIELKVEKIAQSIESSNRRLDSHAERIDQLYGMFVELVKKAK